jgi:hypothetical protein
VATQNDSAPAAVNFINLLFIGISLDIGVPWRDSGPLQSILAMYGRIRTAVRCKGRIQRSDTWAGEGSRSVSQSGGKRGANSHCHGRLPKIISIPIADVLEDGSHAQCYVTS